MSKKIHVTWPVLCKVELECSIRTLNRILEIVDGPFRDDMVVSTMKSAITSSEKALEVLEQTYGK